MPLFNKNILNQRIASYTFPKGKEAEEIGKLINQWQKALKDSDLSKTKEKSIQGKFLNVFFEQILGYTDKTRGEEEWSLIAEPKTEVDTQTADGALGFFTTEKKETKAVIELKDAKTPLDKKQTGREKGYTPIEQGYLYATKFDRCEWIIVSNFREIRFYSKARSEQFFEKFDILELHKEENFRKFYYLLNKDNLIRKDAKSPVEDLVEKSLDQQENISKSFYLDFKEVRINLFNHLIEQNKDIDKEELLKKAQKILDRIVFILFCEDSANLLPKKVLKDTYELGKRSRQRSDEKIWSEIKNLFMDIDIGREDIEPSINAYNGGLFKQDDVLESLSIKDYIWEDIIKLSEYDFESDLNVNILGHIFEQSISDLEEIKEHIALASQKDEIITTQSGEPLVVGEKISLKEKKGRRKKEGIFYTPEYITKYIVENTVGKYLEENPTKLKDIKILDPACGSGAFLNQAHSFLLNEYKVRHEEKIIEKEKKGQHLTLFDYNPAEANRAILLNNLYGVDLNDESAEITKLALWLKTARQDEPLQSLDENIKTGNSLIDDPDVAGEKAFKWEEEFKGIMNKGGFDVIIGNPPYGVNFSDIEKKHLAEAYPNVPDYEIYIYFISKALDLLNHGGLFSYIFPNTFLSNLFGKKYRRWLLENFTIKSIVNLSKDKTFEDASVRTCILTVQKKKMTKESLVSLYNYENLITDIISPIREIKMSSLEDEINNWLSLTAYSEDDIKLIKKLKENGQQLSDFFDVSQGLIPYDKYRGHSAETIKNRIWHTPKQETIEHKKELKGEDVSRYIVNWNQKTWIKYGNWLAAPREPKFFTQPRVLIREITDTTGLIVAYTEEEFYNTPSIINIINKADNSDKKYLKNLTGILNSKLIGWYHNKTSPKAQKGLFPKILINDVRYIPIPNLESLDSHFTKSVEMLVDYNYKLDQISNEAQLLLNSEYKIKFSNSIIKFGWNELIEKFEKQRIKLSLSKKEELQKWFRKKQNELQKLESKIDQLEKEINDKVYQLYNLEKKEISLIERELLKSKV